MQYQYPMNSPKIKQYIRERRDLFWYTPRTEDKKEDISQVLIKAILNDGSVDDVRLIKLTGIGQLFKGPFEHVWPEENELLS